MKILLSLLLVLFCTTVQSQTPEKNSTTTETTPLDTTVKTTSTEQSTITTPDTPPTTTPATTTTPAAPPTTPPTTPPDTTSTSSSTTPEPVTTTVTPPPDKCNWNVTEGNVTCIRAEMEAQFIFVNKDKKSYINLGCNATVLNQDCSSNTTQALVLSEKDEYTLTMVFEKKSDKFSVKNVTLEYALPDGEKDFASNDGDKLFSVTVGNSYLCKSKITVPLGNVTLEISELHIQAFTEKDGNFGSAEECDAVSDMVPIIVGVALASLIIIVLIAYLVGRRRSRQRGYQSV